MLRRVALAVIGVALIIDGLAGWSTDVVAVLVGLVLVGAVSIDTLAKVAGRPPVTGPDPPQDRPT
jgi:hypothetical protein